jgi:diguanylate cyclase (GGDEF)-like protein
MTLDYNSLLLALGFSSICLMVTLFGTWFSRRADSFLLTLATSLALTVAAIFSYSSYTLEAGVARLVVSFFFLMAGFSTIYAASVQFRTGGSPWRLAAALTALMLVIGLPFVLSGYDGIGIIEMNVAATVLMIGTARQYWLARREAPGPLIGLAILYLLTGISFAFCALVLLAGRQWIIGHAPSNWAETLNIGLCIACMTGIGALSLAMHQWRLAAHHRREANTDPLTGLLNRRALFDEHGSRVIGPSTAVVVFDIDRFKSINDQHGHATGDLVLKVFAEDLIAGTEGRETVARLGGEEFAVILGDVMPGLAERIAGTIARRFADREFAAAEMFQCTVSAGVAFGAPEGQSFETVLNLADKALYEAKRGGRNRIEVGGFLHAVEKVETRTTA